MFTKPGCAVLCYGDPCADVMIGAAQPPALGEKVLGTPLGTQAGGTTANVACALARLGTPSAAFGRIGDDAHGTLLRESFAAFGVATASLRLVPGAVSSSAVIISTPGGEKSVIYQPMAGRLFDPAGLAPAVAGARLLYAMPYDLAEFEAVARIARAAGALVAIDLEAAVAPDWQAMERRAALADIVFFNESGFRAGVGWPPSLLQLQRVLALGPGVVAVTLGERGALAATRDGFAEQAAFPAQVLDTAGAGDCFNAAFLHAWLGGADLAQSLRFGCAAASCAVAGFGARAALPAAAQVAAVLAKEAP